MTIIRQGKDILPIESLVPLIEKYKPITFPKYFHQKEIRKNLLKTLYHLIVPYRNVFYVMDDTV